MRITACILSGMLLVAASCKKSNLPAENVKPDTENARIGKVERGIPLPDTYTSENYKLAEVFIKQEDIAPLLYDRTNTLKYAYDASGRLSTLTDEFKGKRRNGAGPNPPLIVIDFTKEYRFAYEGNTTRIKYIECWMKPLASPNAYMQEKIFVVYNADGLVRLRNRYLYNDAGINQSRTEESYSYSNVAANYVSGYMERRYEGTNMFQKNWRVDSETGNYLLTLQNYPADAYLPDSISIAYNTGKPGQPGDPEYLKEQMASGLPIFQALNLPIERREESISILGYEYEFDAKARIASHKTVNRRTGKLLRTATIKYVNN